WDHAGVQSGDLAPSPAAPAARLGMSGKDPFDDLAELAAVFTVKPPTAEAERLAKEAERKAEAERLAKEAERKAEAERLAKEAERKAEAERVAEAERLAREEAERNVKNDGVAEAARSADVKSSLQADRAEEAEFLAKETQGAAGVAVAQAPLGTLEAAAAPASAARALEAAEEDASSRAVPASGAEAVKAPLRAPEAAPKAVADVALASAARDPAAAEAAEEDVSNGAVAAGSVVAQEPEAEAADAAIAPDTAEGTVASGAVVTSDVVAEQALPVTLEAASAPARATRAPVAADEGAPSGVGADAGALSEEAPCATPEAEEAAAGSASAPTARAPDAAEEAQASGAAVEGGAVAEEVSSRAPATEAPRGSAAAAAGGSAGAAAAAAEESEYETDSEDEGSRANPELGLKRAAEETTDPWQLAIMWLVGVIRHRLEAKPAAVVAAEANVAACKKIRPLLPPGDLSAQALEPEHLADGQLLCALVLAIKPDAFPKVLPVTLGRIAQFIKACKDLGVHQNDVFTPPDLMPDTTGRAPQNPDAVLRCLQALAVAVQARADWAGKPALAGAAAKGKGRGMGAGRR
ncbi:unnamed protein product, partial [Prorocentrum cordatum]